MHHSETETASRVAIQVHLRKWNRFLSGLLSINHNSSRSEAVTSHQSVSSVADVELVRTLRSADIKLHN